MPYIVESPYLGKLDKFSPRGLQFLPASPAEIAHLSDYLQKGLGGSLKKEDWGRAILPCVDTLKAAEGARRFHSLEITAPLVSRTNQGRMLDSPDLPKNLGRLATAIEEERAFWFLCKAGFGETINPKLVGIDYLVNTLARPTSDMARWLSGKEKINLGDLALTMAKGGLMGAGSGAILYASLSHDNVSKPLVLACGFVTGVGTVAAHVLPWTDLQMRGYTTYSPGEKFFLFTGQYTTDSPEENPDANP